MRKIIFLFCMVALMLHHTRATAQQASLKNADFPQNDIRLCYGMTTVYNMAIAAMTTTTMAFIVPFDSAYRSTVRGYGAFGFQYQYRISKLIQLGALVSVNPGTVDLKFDKGTTAYISTLFVSFMPRVDFYYLNRGIVSVYSGLALGATYFNFKGNYSAQPDSSSSGIGFGFQLNGVGIRVGKAVGGFVEMGYGCQGIINFGLTARL